MKLFSYIVKHDSGFAPNPFWGYCTLACCKPAIRRSARTGDWIAGLSPRSAGHRIVYFMKVEEVLSFTQYYSDPRFEEKKPDYGSRDIVRERGDNIYSPSGHGRFKQLESMHSNGKKGDKAKKLRDLSGENVLVSQNFAYFGRKTIELPPRFDALKVGTGHRNRFSDGLIDDFNRFASRYKTGRRSLPKQWPMDSNPRQRGRAC